jgi:hypothetical protein
MRGHRIGPIKEGQKVRLELDAMVIYTTEGLMLLLPGGLIGLDDGSIVSMEFLEQPAASAAAPAAIRCPARVTNEGDWCWLAHGHRGMHSSGDGLNKVEWP